MNDWKRVREIFDDALGHPPADRSSFVVSACGGNDDLLREVDSLLKALDSAELFLETPAMVQVVENSLGPEPQLSSGEMLLHYEVRELLGSGGMGEVYLARDTRLNRNVAIKVLRVSFLSDPQAGRRLLREARAAALLEHPNICQIYEISESDEHSFIVMPYLVGETLAEVIKKGGLRTTTALDYATQIVDGLAEAHRNGIIHRDIKPPNVIVSDKGQVKILDFGLAKFIEAESSERTEMHSTGAVMGTVPYMSPEQLKAKPVDARTDIFSVGALLYEMLASKAAFNRETNAETISSILKEDPDWSVVPAGLLPILKRCLAKEVADRYPSANELLSDLLEAGRINFDETDVAGAAETADTPRAETGGSSKKRHLYFWQSGGEVDNGESPGESSSNWPSRVGLVPVGLVVLAVVVLGGSGYWVWERMQMAVPNFDSLRSVRLLAWKSAASTSATNFRISHDGKTIAYSSAEAGGKETIYIKQTAGGEAIQVTRDAFANLSPLWSPDDQSIAYVSVRENRSGIYMTPSFGGTVIPLTITEHPNIALRYWARNDDAIFYEQGGNLYRLDLSSRNTAQVTHFPESPSNTRYFNLSPDESQVVYCDKRDGQVDVWTMPLNGGEPTQLTKDAEEEIYPMWHPDGARVLYNAFRNGLAQINVVGTDGSAPVQVTRSDRHYILIDLSPEGETIYYSSIDNESDVTSVSLDTGRESEIATEPDLEFWSDVSPNGAALVYHLGSPNAILKMYESPLVIRFSDGQRKELSAKGFDARWLPDSRRLSVLRLNGHEYEVWLVDTVTGEERRITTEDVRTPSFTPMPLMLVDTGVLDFSPDGDRFVYVSMRRPQNVKVGSVDAEGVSSLTKNENRHVFYLSPKFSPKGAKLAVVSEEESADRVEKISRLHVFEKDSRRDVFSTTDTVRFIGWSNEDELILAATPERNTAFPMSFNIVAVSTAGSSRRLFTPTNSLFRTTTISPDGRTLAFVANNNDRDDIWTIPLVTGSVPKQATFSPNSRVFFANLVFSPDGRTIYFDKQEEVHTISMFENFN